MILHLTWRTLKTLKSRSLLKISSIRTLTCSRWQQRIRSLNSCKSSESDTLMTWRMSITLFALLQHNWKWLMKTTCTLCGTCSTCTWCQCSKRKQFSAPNSTACSACTRCSCATWRSSRSARPSKCSRWRPSRWGTCFRRRWPGWSGTMTWWRGGSGTWRGPIALWVLLTSGKRGHWSRSISTSITMCARGKATRWQRSWRGQVWVTWSSQSISKHFPTHRCWASPWTFSAAGSVFKLTSAKSLWEIIFYSLWSKIWPEKMSELRLSRHRWTHFS